MQFVVGEQHTTKGGYTAIVVFAGSSGRYPKCTVMDCNGNCCGTRSYSYDGKCGGSMSEYDIVPPAKYVWLNVYKRHGTLETACTWPTKLEATDISAKDTDVVGRIKVELREEYDE